MSLTFIRPFRFHPRFHPVRADLARCVFAPLAGHLSHGYGTSCQLRDVRYQQLVDLFGAAATSQLFSEPRCWWHVFDMASGYRLVIRTQRRSVLDVVDWDVWVEDTAVYDSLAAVFGAERICDEE